MSNQQPPPSLSFDQIVKGDVSIKKLSKHKYKLTFSKIGKFLMYQVWDKDNVNNQNDKRAVFYVSAKEWINGFNATNEYLNKKAKKLKSVGLETHHITPLHYSEKIKASMSPEEWAERTRSDAKQGVYHGHHHKNLMGTVGSKTPAERRIRTAIRHRSGGAHELEAKTKDLYSRSVPHKDLLSAAHRIEMRKQAEERKKAAERNPKNK